MSSSLSAVPLDRRRRAAVMAFAMGGVLLVVAITPWLLPAPVVIRALATLLGLAGVMFVLSAAGLARTVRSDARPAPVPVRQCGCGHAHDMAEMTVVHDAECPSGGACGTGSACGSCALRG